jgi:hypothetical protein
MPSNTDPNYNSDPNIEYANNPDTIEVHGISDYGPAVVYRVNGKGLEISADQAEEFAAKLIAAAKVARELDAAENLLI